MRLMGPWHVVCSCRFAMRKRVVIVLLALPIGFAIWTPLARVSAMRLMGNTDTPRTVVTRISAVPDGAQLVIVGALLVALARVVGRPTETVDKKARGSRRL